MTNRQVKAIGEIGLGSLRVTSGILTALGHGFIAGHCNPAFTRQLALKSVKGGTEMVRAGLREFMA